MTKKQRSCSLSAFFIFHLQDIGSETPSLILHQLFNQPYLTKSPCCFLSFLRGEYFMKNNNIDNTISPLPRNLKNINFSKISKFKNIKPSDNVKGQNLLQNLLIFDMIESLLCILQFFFHLHYSIGSIFLSFFGTLFQINFETLGLKFSNETRFCETACILTTFRKFHF